MAPRVQARRGTGEQPPLVMQRIPKKISRVRERSGAGHRTVPDALSFAIGARIRALREELELSFADFVVKTKLGAGYISELERGLVMPSIGTLARVAEALDVTIADLVVGNTERERIFRDLRRAKPALLREIRALLGATTSPNPSAARGSTPRVSAVPPSSGRRRRTS